MLTTLAFDDPNMFADWLEDFNYFDLGHLAALEPFPQAVDSGLEAPTEVSFQLGCSLGGSYDAGQVRRIGRYQFRAGKVRQWTISETKGAPYDFETRAIESLLVDDEVDFLDVVLDNNIRLQCQFLLVEALPDVNIINRPFVDLSHATQHVPGAGLPTPGQWIEWLAQAGYDVSWRQIYGESRAPESLPQKEYEGWFLQINDAVNSTDNGVMLKSLVAFEDGFFAEFEDWNSLEDGPGYSEMWKALSCVAARVKDISVRSGNCLLSGSEWHASIEAGVEFLETLDFEHRSKHGVPNGWFPYIQDAKDSVPSRIITPGGHVSNFGLWPYVKKELID